MCSHPFAAMPEPICREIQVPFRQLVVHKEDVPETLPCSPYQLQGLPKRHLVQQAHKNSLLPCPFVIPKVRGGMVSMGYVQPVP